METRIEHGMVVAGHLGGYVPGGDPATQYPDLWDWFVDTLGVRSVLDVGCGEGQALHHFRARGCTVVGLDGIPQDDPDIHEVDFTTDAAIASYTHLVGRRGWHPEGFHLGWCCEVVEHIEERHLAKLLYVFSSCSFVAITHAMPGQAGWHHVNCRTTDYWIGAFATQGFAHDEALTALAREQAARNTDPYNHFVRSGLVFRRTLFPTIETAP
jgi:hypothetical protein